MQRQKEHCLRTFAIKGALINELTLKHAEVKLGEFKTQVSQTVRKMKNELDEEQTARLTQQEEEMTAILNKLDEEWTARLTQQENTHTRLYHNMGIALAICSMMLLVSVIMSMKNQTKPNDKDSENPRNKELQDEIDQLQSVLEIQSEENAALNVMGVEIEALRV